MNGCASRERFLSGDELAHLFRAMKRPKNRIRDLVDFVKLALWTGARRSDVLSMKWEDLALVDNTWRVPMSKGGKPYLLPLVPEAVQILKRVSPSQLALCFRVTERRSISSSRNAAGSNS